ncbi:MAG: hypothetical protein HC915_18225 [Anaerolineae bacterium]|nr:hypothetical protein [Anaerolineae bacterium]
MRSNGGDFAHYIQAAQAFARDGDFSDRIFLLRPPLFPLVVYALDVNQDALLLLNSVLGALMVPLGVVMARQFGLGERLALLAGLVGALDLGAITYSAFLGPEPSANLLLLAMMVLLLAALRAERRGWLWGVAAGLCLVLSVYSRPASYLIWIPLGAWALLSTPRAWRAVLSFALLGALGAGAWIVHNGRTFDFYTMTSTSSYTLLYYRAASLERLASGDDMDTVYVRLGQRVEVRLGRDPNTVTREVLYTSLTPTAAEADAMQAEAWAIIRANPHYYLATLPLGLYRIYNSTEHYGGGVRWADRAWNALFVLGTALGLWAAWQHRNFALFWCVLLVGAYFTLGTLAVKTSASDTRMRSMLTPWMAVACVYGYAWLFERWQHWRAARKSVLLPA